MNSFEMMNCYEFDVISKSYQTLFQTLPLTNAVLTRNKKQKHNLSLSVSKDFATNANKYIFARVPLKRMMDNNLIYEQSLCHRVLQ